MNQTDFLTDLSDEETREENARLLKQYTDMIMELGVAAKLFAPGVSERDLFPLIGAGFVVGFRAAKTEAKNDK